MHVFYPSGVHLRRNDSSIQPVQPSEAQIFRPVLQPSEAIPPIGTRQHKKKVEESYKLW